MTPYPGAAWASSGLMALTGHPEGPPLMAPGDPAGALCQAANDLAAISAAVGHPVRVDGPGLAAERAALLGLSRRGSWSPGGTCRMLPAADGWLALNLPRPDDLDLLPAWLGCAPTWAGAAPAIERRPVADLVATAIPLGLALAAVPQPEQAKGLVPVGEKRPIGRTSPTRTRGGGWVVVDLSGLWAGPLAGALMAAAGCRVIKVESTRRPDGARRDNRTFYDLLNTGKQSVALDFGDPDGRAALRDLVVRADLVIEASRPRALAQLDLGPDAGGVRAGQVWLSITAHGRSGPDRQRAGFGDDTAVAGGLVAWAGDSPMFCGDAFADPATGLRAAVAGLEALATGRSGLIELAMRDVVAAAVGDGRVPTLQPDTAILPPRARPAPKPTAPLGRDTTAVLAEL